MSIVLIICNTKILGMIILLYPLLIAMIMIGGDNDSYDLDSLFKPHDEYVFNNI